MSATATNRIPFILTSKDPSFAGLLEHLCHESSLHLLTTAGPSITLETVRSNTPAFVLLDLDSIEPVETTRLIMKLALASSAFVFLTGSSAVPGAPAMDQFYQAGAHGTILKPDGKTSVSLAGEPGKAFLQQLVHTINRFLTRRME